MTLKTVYLALAAIFTTSALVAGAASSCSFASCKSSYSFAHISLSFLCVGLVFGILWLRLFLQKEKSSE